MPKWWQKARDRLNARDDDPDAVGLGRDEAYDDAFDAFREGDPEKAQDFIYTRAQETAEQRAGAGTYHNLARGHADRAQRDDVYTRPGTPDGGDPDHRVFDDVAPRPEMEDRGGYLELTAPRVERGTHLHPELGCVHNHVGGHIPHGHSDFAWQQAGYDPPAGPASGTEPAAEAVAEAAATLPESLTQGAMAGVVASTPLAATSLGGGGLALGGVLGALTGAGLHYRRQRAGGMPANPSPWTTVVPVLLAAALAVPSDHIDWEYESEFHALSPPAATEAAEEGEDPAADDADRDIAEAAVLKYRGVTADGRPCALGQDGPALCYHQHEDGGPDLARGASNNLTRGGDAFGLDDAGQPCLLGTADCRPSPDDPPGVVLPGGTAVNWDVPWGPPAAPQPGRLPDGRGCFVGFDPDCASVPEAELAAGVPGFGVPPPPAVPPAGEPQVVPTLAPLAGLECLAEDPSDCIGFGSGPSPWSGGRFGGLGGDPWNSGPGGGSWYGVGPNPGNIESFEVLLPHVRVRGCDVDEGTPCYRTLSRLKAEAEQLHAQGVKLPGGAVMYVCPAVEGWRHTPSNPVLDTQAQLSGQRADEVGLFVDTRDGAEVTWEVDRNGQLRFTVKPDPAVYVFVRKQLTAETIAWINSGEVQQRFPGAAAQVTDTCFENWLHAGKPLHSWHPVDPGTHRLSEATVVSKAGALGHWDEGYDFHVALAIASASR